MRFKDFVAEAKKGPEWATRDWTAEADALEKSLREDGHDPGENGNVGKAFQLARDCFNAVAAPGSPQHQVLHGDLNKVEVDYDRAEMEGDYDKMHKIIQGPLNGVRHIHRIIRKRVIN